MSKENPAPSETTAILDRIRKNGDVIDQNTRHKLPLGLIALGATGFTSGIVPGARVGITSLEVLASAPAYSAGVGLLSAGVYTGIRWRDGKRQRQAETDQTRVREALGEPVDVVRTGTRKSSALTLRWYGADNTVDANRTDHLISRLRKVTEFAEREGIGTVAIGADWLQEIVGKEGGSTDYGVLVDGEDAVMARRASLVNIGVNDHEADQLVLVARNTEMLKLVEKLEAVETQALVKDLMLQVTDEVLLRSYQSMLKSDMTTEDFKQHVHTALEREYNRHDTASLHRQWDRWNNKQDIHQVNSYKTVKDGRVQSLDNWFDRPTGTSQQAYGGDEDLLRTQGVETFDGLIKKVMSKNNLTDQRGVLAALYLGLRQAEQPRDYASNATSSENATLFQRMATERLRTWRTLQKPRRAEGGPTLEYTDSLSRKSLIAMGASALTIVPFLGAMVGGVPALVYKDHAEAGIEQRHAAALAHAMAEKDSPYRDEHGSFDKDKFNQDYNKALERAGDSFDQQYLDAYTNMEGFDRKISSYMIDKYMYVLEPFNKWKETHQFDKWRMNAIKGAPGMGAIDDGKEHIGDVPSDGDNKSIYSIRSLNGQSTAGYWYGSVYTSMAVGRDGLEYRDNAWTQTPKESAGEQIMHTSALWSPETIASVKPDYLVETPYLLGEDGSVNNKQPLVLPMKQHGQIAALRIVDANDESKMLNGVEFETQEFNGTARLQMTDALINQIHDADIKEPKLQYWVKIDQQVETVGYNGNMEYPTDVDMAAVSRDVRKVLGLPENASDSDVLNSIRNSKHYSFTPLADEHTDLKVHAASTEDELRQIGTTLAGLDALNCNLAQTLMLLAKSPDNHYTKQAGFTDDQYDSDLAPVSGFHDDGDGELVRNEAHAWLVDANNQVVDPTPALSEDQAKKMMKPASMEVPKPLSVPFEGIAQGTFGALLALTAWRRREQIRRLMDETRSTNASSPAAASGAIGAIQTALYGAEGSKWVVAKKMTPAEVRRAVLSSIPEGGVSLKEVQQRLDNKDIDYPLSLRDKLAIRALRASDGAIRRTMKR